MLRKNFCNTVQVESSDESDRGGGITLVGWNDDRQRHYLLD